MPTYDKTVGPLSTPLDHPHLPRGVRQPRAVEELLLARLRIGDALDAVVFHVVLRADLLRATATPTAPSAPGLLAVIGWDM